MKKTSVKGALRIANNFIVFFLTIGFAVSCCMMLFLSTMEDSMGLTYTAENIASAAKITFINVLILTLIFATIDHIRRKVNVDRPAKIITDTTEKIMQGDFSARVPNMHGAGMEGFNRIGLAVNSMASELSSVETLRTDFIANVSHEMKTPLAVMQNYGTLLQSPDLGEEERIEYAKGVTDASRRMADMMTNILKLNRLENQQIYPEISEYDLGEQLCECLLQYESVWESSEIEIDTDIEEGVMIKADAELLNHVWNNLFSNAFKFTDKGGKVSVSLSATEHHAVVKVTDTGCGMSPEVGAHIFEKFYQGDKSRSVQGNGLGLALVKRVVDIMKGEISVESAVGKGSTFTVRMRRT
ncbi:MAG: HAMP domain-containing histidine kinase [Ruminococcaceae bacterium]|nr:HAMP domain-containing histidine kinase [Oscillospiraceae bacterium]